MAFQTIGFHAALILNRLRNERQITKDKANDDADRQKHDEQEQAVRAELERLNKKLSLLSERVEPPTTGRECRGKRI